MLNPLIDEIFELLLTQRVWKVHTLAATLAQQGVLPPLDAVSYTHLRAHET